MAIKDDMEDVQEAVINALITENGITNTLADDQVTEDKIDDGAVTPAKLSQSYLPLTGGSVSGNVGIGITNPSSYNAGAYNLVVGNPSLSSQGMTIAAGTSAIIYFADGTSGSEPYTGSIIYNHTYNNMTFRTNGFNSALVIDGNQHVILSNVPTSSTGLATGTIYSDGGTLKIV